MKVNIQIEGLEELKQRTDNLSKRRMSGIVRNAVTFGATPIAQAARRLVPQDTRQLRKSLAKKVKSYGATAIAIVGVSKEGFKALVRSRKEKRMVLRNPVKYAHLVEKGHRIAILGKLSRKGRKGTGAAAGFVAPRPFIGPAYESTKDDVRRRIEQKITEGIEKAVS